MKPPVKVLIIDDSELIRNLLTTILSSDSNIEVIGCAIDPYDAREKIKRLNPDVLTLDIEMPRMDGITFLKNIMRLRPMPVVMLSTLTEKGGDITLEALQHGAIDYISKPKLDVKSALPALSADICNKVKNAAKANIRAIENTLKQQPINCLKVSTGTKRLNTSIDAIAIGASTGGTEAIKQILLALPEKMPPIIIAQHMPGGFTASFAKRLNSLCQLTVKEFSDEEEPLLANHVYIANGLRHITVIKKNSSYYLQQSDSPEVNRHKPSVDVLFNSIAETMGKRCIGVILTGMGIDGAHGLKNIYDREAFTIAQDENSSIVWGMPRVAIEQGGASEVLPLQEIGNRLIQCCY